MKKKFLFLTVISFAIAAFLITGCKKETASDALEPITILLPDTAISFYFPDDSVPMSFKFTTDRPINWIMGKYDIDSTGAAGYTATYPDTLFFEDLSGLSPRVNRHDYTATYYVPSNLMPFDHVRFKISFEAGSSTFTTGQNYPAGKVGASKEFRVDVR